MVRTAPPPVGRDGRSALPGARMRDSQAPFARDLDAIPCAGWVARKPAKIIGIELDELPDRPSRVVAEVQSRCVEARSSARADRHAGLLADLNGAGLIPFLHGPL